MRILPNAENCLQQVQALAVEIYEAWIDATRHLNMELLAEQEKVRLRQIAEAA